MKSEGQLVGNIKKKGNDQRDAIGNGDLDIKISEVNPSGFFFHDNEDFLIRYAINRVIIPKKTSTSKSFPSFCFGFLEPIGTIMVALNHAADILAMIWDVTSRKTGSIFTINNLAVVQIGVNQIFKKGAVG